jgi:hypothetical protein
MVAPSIRLFAVFPSISRFDNNANNSQDNKHNENKVLHSFPAELAKAVQVFVCYGVGSKDGTSRLDFLFANAVFRARKEQDSSKGIGSYLYSAILVYCLWRVF